MFYRKRSFHALGGIILGCILPFMPTAAHASNLFVTNLLDSGPGSLRQALSNNAASGGGNTILFSNVSGTILLTNSYLLINQPVVISGPGAPVLAVSGGGAFQVFVINATNATVSISGLTITRGLAQNTGTTYSPDGGGICQEPGSGQLIVSNCVITNNAASAGGGIDSEASLQLLNSTVAGNSSLLLGGGVSVGGTAAIYNCTIASNTVATTFAFGGGIYSDGTLSLSCCTIVSNYQGSGNGSGGGIYMNAGTVTMTNCIVAKNYADSRQGADLSGTFISGGWNLIGTNNGESGMTNGVKHDQVGSSGSPIDPLVGPLGYYGGVTEVMPLINGSPCIDTGFSAGLTTDQRGRPRPTDLPWIANTGDGSDIGAFEYDAPGSQTLVINIPITGVTHQFIPASNNPFPQPASILDTVQFAQSNLSGLDLSQYGTLALRLYTTNGQELIVNTPSNTTCASSLDFSFIAAGDVSSNSSTAVLSFEGFTGAAPSRTYNFFATGGNGNAFILEAEESFPGPFGFTAMEYSFKPVDIPTNSSKTFVPNSANQLGFGCYTSHTNDPGPLVTLGPVLQPNLSKGSGGQLNLRWNSRTNLTLQLQTSTNLTTWQSASNYIGNGQTNVFSDSATGAKKFYRLKVVAPN